MVATLWQREGGYVPNLRAGRSSPGVEAMIADFAAPAGRRGVATRSSG
jgi:hypothetical protein